MTTNHRIEIPLSKQKTFLMLLGSVAFLAIGFWFVIAPPAIENRFGGHPVKMMILGYAAILFGGAGSYYFVRKLQDDQPGLILDEDVLTGNSSAVSAGKIPWADIEEISVIEIQKQKLIMLYVKDPQA